MPLRVTIELIPHGIESMKETVFSLYIRNDGSGSKDYGNYVYDVEELVDDMHWNNTEYRDDDAVTRTFKRADGYIGGFPRKRTAKELLHKILEKLILKERNEANSNNL